MVDKIGSGAAPAATAQTNATENVDNSKVSENKTTPQPPAENLGPNPAAEQKGQTAKFSEFALLGMARAAQLKSFAKAETPASKLPTEEILKRNDFQKDPKPEVQELQQQVNQWRAENGKPPIKEDGYFGPKTEKAVQEFQKANGLKKDGKAGIQTQNRVLLENDSNFKQLDGGIKDQTRKLMTDYNQDKTKVENLRNFATSPGLSKLSPAHQQQMLDMQKAHPDDAKFTSQLGTLANDATFRNLNDATKTEVLKQVSGYAGDPAKIDNLTKLVTAKGFDKLSEAGQKKMMDALKTRPDDGQLAEGLGKMAGSSGFRNSSDTVKDSVVDTIAKNPPATSEKVDNTLKLIGSPDFTKLPDANKKLVTDGLAASKADPKYAENVKNLLADKKFESLKPEEKTAVLSQVKNYPDSRAVENFQRMLHKDWFTSQNLADKQRSLKTIGYLSSHDTGDRKLVDNTLNKLLDPKSDLKLKWEPLKGNIHGKGNYKTDVLTLNERFVAAGNEKMVENKKTTHLVLSTAPHEVNHILNKDWPANKYKYFEAEYRAWYVGFQTRYGKPPTNAEAMKQRISWQLKPESSYGKYAQEALKDPKEAAKFYDLLSKMSGQKVDASNWEEVIKSNPNTWPTATDPAPVPGGNIDNH